MLVRYHDVVTNTHEKAYALPSAVETVLPMTYSGTIHGQEFNFNGTVHVRSLVST